MIVQLVVASGNRKGQVIPVTTEKFIIGRAADSHLKPTSELVSRYHCAILLGDDVVVRDLGSRNGVRLNGEKISAERKVNNGDKLGIGPLEFFVHISPGEPLTETLRNHDASWNPPGGAGTYSETTAPTVLMNSRELRNIEE